MGQPYDRTGPVSAIAAAWRIRAARWKAATAIIMGM